MPAGRVELQHGEVLDVKLRPARRLCSRKHDHKPTCSIGLTIRIDSRIDLFPRIPLLKNARFRMKLLTDFRGQ